MKLNLSFERSLNPFAGPQIEMVFKGGQINTDWETRKSHIEQNIRLPLPQVRTYTQNSRQMIICGGGPSLAQHIDKVKELREAGAALCAINNAHQWLQDEHKLIPSVYIGLDSREFNSRFVRTPHKDCKYLISNSCHPSVFETLKDYETYIWHPDMDEDPDTEGEEAILNKYYGKNHWTQIPGGSTGFLRAFLVLRTLGYGNFHVFGFDSCYYPDGSHHSYEQPENDKETLWKVSCLGKEFYAAGWQIKQYEEFVKMFAAIGQVFRMEIYGDGMPAHMIRQLSRRPVQLRLFLLDRLDKILKRDLKKKYLIDHDADIEEETNGGSSV